VCSSDLKKTYNVVEGGYSNIATFTATLANGTGGITPATDPAFITGAIGW